MAVEPRYPVPTHLEPVRKWLSSGTDADLFEAWESHGHRTWEEYPDFYLQAGRRFVKTGELLLGHHVLSVGLEAIFPRHVQPIASNVRPKPEPEPEYRDPAEIAPAFQHLYAGLSQQKALALAQLGCAEQARTILDRLYHLGFRDGETEGILARTYKDQGLIGDPKCDPPLKRGRSSLLRAKLLYSEGAARCAVRGDHAGAFYNWINVAFCAFILEEWSQCQLTVNEVQRQLDACEAQAALRRAEAARGGTQAAREGREDPWWWSAQGSVYLYKALLKEREEGTAWEEGLDKARDSYIEAVSLAEGNHREIATMAKQKWRIASVARERHLTFPDDLLGIFDVLSVLSFSASGSDASVQCEGTCRSLSPGEKALIYSTIRIGFDGELAQRRGVKAYTTLSCPAEILFVEAVLHHRQVREILRPGHAGVAVHVIVPYDREEVRKDLGDPYWMERFDAAWQAASTRAQAGEIHGDWTKDYLRAFAAPYVHGMARLSADSLNARAQVLDAKRERRAPCIRPYPCNEINEKIQTSPTERLVEGRSAHAGVFHHYLPILYADVEHYGSLTDPELLLFSEIFFPKLRLACLGAGFKDYTLRTQGDSVLMSFKDLVTAVRAACALRQLVMGMDWKAAGLSRNLRIRIALDAGPCCYYHDQATDRIDLCGYYVNRAARIEPITPSGEIYASESFASLWRMKYDFSEFEFVPAGRKVLPKGHGVVVAYQLRPRGGWDSPEVTP